MAKDAVKQVMELYPRIYFACHTRHVRDPQSHRLLSAHQASILDHLDEHEPLSLLDLARHMGVTPSTMSLNIERLVRRGYVSRDRAGRRWPQAYAPHHPGGSAAARSEVCPRSCARPRFAGPAYTRPAPDRNFWSGAPGSRRKRTDGSTEQAKEKRARAPAFLIW